MREMLALTRYVFAQHRFSIFFLLALIVVAEVFALVSASLMPTLGECAPPMMALFLGLMPAGVAALLLFDYGHSKDLMSGESCCSEWVLRMPIATSKIALVPIALKTVWISAVWTLFAVSIISIGVVEVSDGFPILNPCILFSAIMTWMLAISWRPFRNGWFRLGLLIFVAIVLYLGLVAVFMSHSPHSREWQPLAIIGSYSLSITLFASGAWFAIRSAELARTANRGLIPEHSRAWGDSRSGECEVRHHVTARRALIWHDLERTKNFIRYTLIFAVIPTVLFTTFLIPLHAASVGVLFIVYAYFGAIAACGIDGTGHNGTRTIPPHLVASPLSTATIAWTRLFVNLAVMAALTLCIAFTFIGWSFWSENREAWLTWAAERAYSVESSSTPIAVGIRYSLAIVIGSIVFSLGRFVSFMWIGMAGRNWLNVVFGVLMGLLFLVPIGVFLRWFLQQTEWETTTQAMYSWLAWIPYLVGGLLIIKVVCVSAATLALWRSRVTANANILRAFACWSCVTIGIAGLVYLLIPDPRATFLLCLIGAVLMIPLARTLVLPVSLSYNRHR